jgi:SAM-dependent methyltransferase
VSAGGKTGDDVFARERAFHDEWAATVEAEEVDVTAAFEALTAPENRFLLSKMGDLRGRRVLDLGSGLGEAATYFALRGATVTATDISPRMCALAKATARAHGAEIEAIATPVERLDVPPASFDIVYGANLLHHVQDVEGTLAAVERALKPGGRCFFWDPLAYNPAINVYRRIASGVRTVDERPLTFGILALLRRRFVDVGHREFWLASLALFLKYYFVDRLDPNRVRYWKRILREDPAAIGWWFAPLQRVDGALLRLPLVRRLAWNIAVWGTRPA